MHFWSILGVPRQEVSLFHIHLHVQPLRLFVHTRKQAKGLWDSYKGAQLVSGTQLCVLQVQCFLLRSPQCPLFLSILVTPLP